MHTSRQRRCLHKSPGAICFAPQEDAPALNRCYSALLATCFASAAGTSQQGSPAAPDLALCTRVWEGWQRQLQLAKGRAEPESPEAAEASAVTVLLGQRQYNAGGLAW